MSDITVTSVTQRIIVDAASGTASVILAGPVGPPGPEGDYHMYVGPTPPPSPEPNDFWVDNDTAAMYMYYNDGTSSQWIEIGSFDPAQIDAALIAADPDAQAVLDARYVRDAGDTMTGTLEIANTSPRVLLRETDRVAGNRLWRILVNAGVFTLHQVSDDELTVTKRVFSFDSATGLINLDDTGVTGVRVPTPTATTHAARKDYVDTADALKVAKTGDTMTGNLTITNTAPRLRLTESDAVANKKTWRIMPEGTVLAVSLLDDAETAAQVTGLTINGTTGLVALNGTGVTSVQVPAISGVSQAAQVTAYDAALGRLAIGGRELGATGWRNITASLGPGYGGVGSVFVNRIGYEVHVRFSNLKLVTAAVLWTPTAGFQLSTYSNIYFSYGDRIRSTISAAEVRPNATSTTIIMNNANTVGVAWNDATDSAQGAFSYLTDAAWPVTLPGVAA